MKYIQSVKLSLMMLLCMLGLKTNSALLPIYGRGLFLKTNRGTFPHGDERTHCQRCYVVHCTETVNVTEMQ